MKEFDFKNPNYRPIVDKRLANLEKLKADKQLAQSMWQHYSNNNSVDFINDWMWLHEPRYKPTIRPFWMFEHQIKYLNWIDQRVENNEDGLCEKSRAMGVTWLNCAYAVYRIIFFEGEKIAFGSRKEALVDRIDDMDSIFEKMRFLVRKLPKEYGHGIVMPFMKIINPKNGSTVTGEAGDNIGRGGRSKIYFKDESAFYERPQRIDAALSENSDIKIDVSTPNGADNPFYKKRHSGNIPVFTFHWTNDPRKDQAWYDAKKKTLDEHIIAQEIDIDYSASLEDVCIQAKWVRAAVNAHEKIAKWTEDTGKKRAGFDISDGGKNFNALTIAHGSRVLLVMKWRSLTTTEATRKAYGLSEMNQVTQLKYDAIGVGAGAKGEFAEITKDKPNKLEVIPILSGTTKLHGYWTEERKNVDMFKNYRAQMWWEAKRRFKRTYEVVEGLADHDIDLLISIPNQPELIKQLSQPKEHYTDAGKIGIESKIDMGKRGVESPDEGDSLIYCFATPSNPTYGGW